MITSLLSALLKTLIIPIALVRDLVALLEGIKTSSYHNLVQGIINDLDEVIDSI